MQSVPGLIQLAFGRADRPADSFLLRIAAPSTHASLHPKHLEGCDWARRTNPPSGRRDGTRRASLSHSGSRFGKQTCTSLEFPLSVTPVTPPTQSQAEKTRARALSGCKRRICLLQEAPSG